MIFFKSLRGWTKHFRYYFEECGFFVPLLGSILLLTIWGFVSGFLLRNAWIVSIFCIFLAVGGSGILPMILSMAKARKYSKSPFFYSQD